MDEQMPQNEPRETTPPKEGSLGPVVGTIVIIAILVIGGLYYWGEKLNNDQAARENLTGEDIAGELDPTLDALGEQSASDTVESIEEDLNATDLNNLDQELKDLEAEFSI